MVISPTLDFRRAISSSRPSRSRAFNAVAAPDNARSRHSVSLGDGYCNLTSGNLNLVCGECPGFGAPSTGAIHHWYSMEF